MWHVISLFIWVDIFDYEYSCIHWYWLTLTRPIISLQLICKLLHLICCIEILIYNTIFCLQIGLHSTNCPQRREKQTNNSILISWFNLILDIGFNTAFSFKGRFYIKIPNWKWNLYEIASLRTPCTQVIFLLIKIIINSIRSCKNVTPSLIREL